MKRFHDRAEGGRALAAALRHLAGRGDVLVLGLARGGVPVAYEVAQALDAPLDVFVVRKLGVPGHAELAMGAIASGGVRVMNDSVVHELAIPAAAIERVAGEEARELERRERLFRGDRPAPDVKGRIVVLVDDGLATGSTMRAAVAALRNLGPSRIVVAVPVGAREACEALRREADELVCLEVPPYFRAVGLWYAHFDQTSDAQVRELLDRAARATSR